MQLSVCFGEGRVSSSFGLDWAYVFYLFSLLAARDWSRRPNKKQLRHFPLSLHFLIKNHRWMIFVHVIQSSDSLNKCISDCRNICISSGFCIAIAHCLFINCRDSFIFLPPINWTANVIPLTDFCSVKISVEGAGLWDELRFLPNASSKEKAFCLGWAPWGIEARRACLPNSIYKRNLSRLSVSYMIFNCSCFTFDIIALLSLTWKWLKNVDWVVLFLAS